jgi:hypothetical protein
MVKSCLLRRILCPIAYFAKRNEDKQNTPVKKFGPRRDFSGIEVIYCVYKIFAVASSSDSDAFRYVIIIKLVGSIFKIR